MISYSAFREKLGATKRVWSGKESPLERFLKIGTRNPYIANIVATLATNATRNENSPISLEGALDLIRQHQLDGVIELIGYINAADTWSGGTVRGFYEVGAYSALCELGIRTKVHTGTSIGAVPATFFAIRMHPSNLQIDTSPQNLENSAFELVESLGVRTLYEEPKNLVKRAINRGRKIKLYAKGLVSEGIIDTSGLETFFQHSFGNLKMGNLPGLYIIACDYNSNDEGKKVVLSSIKTPDEFIWEALRKSTASPFLFKPYRVDGSAYADGGLVEVFPCSTAIEDGKADIVIGVLLNYHLPRIESDFKLPHGKVIQALRNFSIMNSVNLDWVIAYHTGKTPLYVAENGDPRGRLLLIMPNLSHVAPDDFYGEGPKLIKPGRYETLDAVAKFFSPNFSHLEYNPEYFLSRFRR